MIELSGRVIYLLYAAVVSNCAQMKVCSAGKTHDLALVFLLLRFSLRTLFFLHLALILACRNKD